MYSSVFACLSLLIVTGISTPAALGQANGATIEVLIERTSDNDWRATFRTDTPVTALAFTRSGDDNRSGNWTVVSEGVTLDRIGDADALVATAERTEFEVHIADNSVPRGIDYTPFVPITDTATAVYSHYFQVAPTSLARLQSGLDPDDLPVPPHAFSFSDATGQYVIFAGDVLAPGVTSINDDELGAYAVFGAPPRESSDSFNSIVSPDLPDYLTEQILNTVPQVISELAEALGTELERTPSLILTRRPNDGSGFYFTGGAMASDVVMEMSGGALDDPEFIANYRGAITALVIHELAHVWNGGLIQNADPNAAWIHEGGAEALSWNALTVVFSTDAEYRLSRHQDHLTDCVAHLAEGGLATAVERGRRRAHYECGATIMLAISSALSPQDQPAGLNQYWSTLIANSQADHDSSYDADLALQTFSGLGGDRVIRDWITAMVDGRYDNPARFLADGLTAAGVSVSLQDGMPVLDY